MLKLTQYNKLASIEAIVATGVIIIDIKQNPYWHKMQKSPKLNDIDIINRKVPEMKHRKMHGFTYNLVSDLLHLVVSLHLLLQKGGKNQFC